MNDDDSCIMMRNDGGLLKYERTWRKTRYKAMILIEVSFRVVDEFDAPWVKSNRKVGIEGLSPYFLSRFNRSQYNILLYIDQYHY